MRGGVVARLVVLALIMLALAPTPAAANSTPTRRPAENGGLVLPTTTPDVWIGRETLSVDLTGVPSAARVRATYELANLAGKPTSLDLAFVAPSGRDLVVSLDGQPLVVSEAPTDGLPGVWTGVTRAIDPLSGAEYEVGAEYGWGAARAWTFMLTLPAGGAGLLVAEYDAPLGYDRSRHERTVRSFAYALGPARNWAGVGRVEIEVVAPAGWVVAASPALARAGGESPASRTVRYAGDFDGVPAEMLRVGLVSEPEPLDAFAPWLSLGLPILAAIALGPLGASLGARLRSRWLAAVAGLIVGGGLSLAGGVLLNSYVFGLLVPLSEELAESMLVVIATVLSAVVVGPLLGGAIGAIGAYVGWGRRARRREVART